MSARFNPALSVITASVRAFLELRLIATLLAFNLALGLLMSFPTLFPLFAALGHFPPESLSSFPSIGLINVAGRLMGKSGSLVPGTVIITLSLSFALQLLLSGGISSRVCSREPFALSEFFKQSARLLGRSIRLTFWAVLGFLPAAGLIGGSAYLLHRLKHESLFTTGREYWGLDTPFNAWSVGHAVFAILVFALWRSSYDVARVQLFADDQRKTRVAAWRALKRMITSPASWFGYALVGALGVVAVTAMLRLHGLVRVDTARRALLALLVAQAVVWVRLAFSVASTAYAYDVHAGTTILEPATTPETPAWADVPILAEPQPPNADPTSSTETPST